MFVFFWPNIILTIFFMTFEIFSKVLIWVLLFLSILLINNVSDLKAVRENLLKDSSREWFGEVECL